MIEKEGLIYEVDKYIWEEACRILKERRDLDLRSLPISINVARGDLYEKAHFRRFPAATSETVCDAWLGCE